MNEERLDRFARGELPPVESRELSRKALEDPELFEELTHIAIARTGLADRTRRRWSPTVALLAAAAILIALLSQYALRQFRPARTPVAALSGTPIFLAGGPDASSVFRGAQPDSREPRTTGSITSLADRIVSIDLGTLDGLSKGAEVDVVRDGQTVGRIKLTTVFRDHARAEEAAGQPIHLHDSIRAPHAMYMRAALDQIAAFSARGDAGGARRTAEQAAAGGTFDIGASDFQDLNNLGGIAELHGNRLTAQSLYQQALSANPPPAARTAIETNLAHVKAMK